MRSDAELIDNAAGAAQCRLLLEDGVVREAISLNVIAPLRLDLRRVDDAWNRVDMARGLIGLGKAHDLLGEALDELSLALAGRMA